MWRRSWNLKPGMPTLARARANPLGRESVVAVGRLLAGRPPHLVVGGRRHPAPVGPGHGAAHRQVQMWRQPALWFDRRKVLHIPADEPAEVLYEPVDQPAEVDRIPDRSAVVVSVGVDRGPVRSDWAVAVQGARDEQRRPEPAGVDATHRGRLDSPSGQVRSVLSALRRRRDARRSIAGWISKDV